MNDNGIWIKDDEYDFNAMREIECKVLKTIIKKGEGRQRLSDSKDKSNKYLKSLLNTFEFKMKN